MGKCFLGLWGGLLLGLAYAVSELSCSEASVAYCLSGALEWVLLGGAFTACAIGGYGVYQAVERRIQKAGHSM